MLKYEVEQKKLAALAVPIQSILEHEGYYPIGGKGFRYYSPFRQERNGSFFVNIKRNGWIDYGITEGHRGGDTINLVQILRNLNFMDAIEYILSIHGQGAISMDAPYLKQSVCNAGIPKHKIISIRHVTDPGLQRYIRQRQISIDVARKYCSEVHYEHVASGRQFFGFGIPNVKGGWVVRTAPYPGNPRGAKLDIIASGITRFSKNPNQVGESAMVFEGFLNYLSWVMLFGEPNIDVIILNSTQNTSALDHISTSGVSSLYVFPDIDKPGLDAMNHLKYNSGCNVIDCSAFYRYEGINDLNDYLIAIRQSR